MTDARGNNARDWRNYVIAALAVVVGILILLNMKGCSSDGGKVIGKDDNGQTVVITDDQTEREFKKRERELYDTIKAMGIKISDLEYALQIAYRMKYDGDTVYIVKKETDTVFVGMDVKTFAYEGGKEDSVSYKLTIGSVAEPDWYKVDFTVNDKIFVANEHNDGKNTTTVVTGNGGEITDIEAYNKKKDRFWKNVCVGPSIGIGYDPANNKFGPSIGISVSYDVFGKLKNR